MVIVVTGGRKYNDRETVFKALSYVHEKRKIDALYHGACSGADLLANEWAIKNNVEVKSFPADWKRFGKSAGPLRNMEMLREAKKAGRAGLVAFPGGKGTQNAVKTAKILKINVWYPVKE